MTPEIDSFVTGLAFAVTVVLIPTGVGCLVEWQRLRSDRLGGVR